MSHSPESVGLSAERLKRIDAYFQARYVGPGKLPGASILVSRKGQTAHFGLVGQADVERAAPLKEDTIFRIYSMTKPLTSVLFMMLVEEGKVALDDPVHRFIPQWRDLGVYQAGFMETFRTTPCKRPMQMVDLLRHTSGLTYGFQESTNVDAAYRKHGIGAFGMKPSSLEETIQQLAKVPLQFSPGDRWNYSVSTDILGYLIQVIEGKPFEQVMKERLTGPLGMDDTDFYVPAGQGRPVRRVLSIQPRQDAGAARRSDPQPLSEAADLRGRGRRARLHHGRLSEVLHHAAEQGRA